MECLVTGAGGFVGRGVIEALAAAGHGGIATGRSAPRHLPPGWVGRERGAILAAPATAGIGVIVHLEVLQDGAGDAAALERVNVGGTAEWLEWAARGGIARVVFMSSMLAVAARGGPILEDAPPATGDSYGATKARAEAAVRAWAAWPGRGAVILRAAPVYAPEAGSNLLALVRRVRAGRPVLLGRGEALRSVVSRRNLAAAVLFALSGPGGCEVYNVADPRPLPMRELAATVAELAGAPPPRALPEWLATAAAPLGTLCGWMTGWTPPVTLARLRELRTEVDVRCDRLVAAGYRHPETTREGLAALVAYVTRGG